MTTSVATIIVTFNRKALLVDCLKANIGQTRPADRIIIVDNASSDGTRDALESEGLLANKAVEYLRLDQNFGAAGGTSRGTQRAADEGFDWIWLMDDDAVPGPDALERLLEGFDSLPASDRNGLCAMTACVTDPQGKIDSMHRRRWNFATLASPALGPQDYDGHAVEIDIGSFVGFLVSRDVVEAIGTPDPDYFIYYEDTEYSLRIRHAGGKIFLCPRSRIAHPENPNDSKAAVRSASYAWRNFYHLRNKVHTYRLYAPNRFIFAYRMLKTLLETQFSVLAFQPDKWARSRSFLKGIRDGVQGKLGKTLDPADF